VFYFNFYRLVLAVIIEEKQEKYRVSSKHEFIIRSSLDYSNSDYSNSRLIEFMF